MAPGPVLLTPAIRTGLQRILTIVVVTGGIAVIIAAVGELLSTLHRCSSNSRIGIQAFQLDGHIHVGLPSDIVSLTVDLHGLGQQQ